MKYGKKLMLQHAVVTFLFCTGIGLASVRLSKEPHPWIFILWIGLAGMVYWLMTAEACLRLIAWILGEAAKRGMEVQRYGSTGRGNQGTFSPEVRGGKEKVEVLRNKDEQL